MSDFLATPQSAWFVLGDAGFLPQHPAAILGTAFHAVVAAAHSGELRVATVSDRSPARGLFDKTARKLHLSAHCLIKFKFPAADRLPFYNLNRERAAITATSIAASRRPSARSAEGKVRLGSAAVRTESRLRSRDGRLVGRADHVDGRSGVVVDYKTGHMSEAEACAMSDSEARQLRLYAYLAAENGTDVGTGAVVRGDGQRCQTRFRRPKPATVPLERRCSTAPLSQLEQYWCGGELPQRLVSHQPLQLLEEVLDEDEALWDPSSVFGVPCADGPRDDEPAAYRDQSALIPWRRVPLSTRVPICPELLRERWPGRSISERNTTIVKLSCDAQQ